MSDEIKQALCCTCGSIRKCRRPRNYRQENYWLRGPVDRDWNREVGDLKCEQCGRVTRHAIILPVNDSWRNHAEKIQEAATGWHFSALDDDGHKRVREQWRQGMPQNPYLRHLWWTRDEAKARESGQHQFQAICKTWIPVPERTCEERNSSYAHDDLIAPKRFHDVDREDPETGLWWFDLDCVDCLYRSNVMALEAQRKALKAKLREVVDKIDGLDAQTVAELLANFGDSESCDT
ncbi:hypothetical protein [Mycolicibacterium mengxianglii]|uniref:hypothetical protein n=1 Tax=Mycolicibacterium mengxianglii TaxID=2736649 RepID=UPI0018D16A86|nr:hypothetical protein [Mycolicibacterium mengxianglii]